MLVVIFIVVILVFVWYFVDNLFIFVLRIFIIVLVIVCLCVLGFVIFIVIMVGIGKGVEYGILIKSGDVLEILYKIIMVVFDKMGIIIEGKLKVIDIILVNGWESERFL